MSRKYRISAVAVGFTSVSASVLADHDRNGARYDERDDYRYDEHYGGNSDYEYARVDGVQPQHRRVRFIGGALIGGLIGGVLGNQVGDGRGRQYVTQMPYDPGERIRIRVDVTPAGA